MRIWRKDNPKHVEVKIVVLAKVSREHVPESGGSWEEAIRVKRPSY